MATGTRVPSAGEEDSFPSRLTPRSRDDSEVMLVVSRTYTDGRGRSLVGLIGSATESSMDEVSDKPLYIGSCSTGCGVSETGAAVREPKKSPNFLESGIGGNDDREGDVV